MTKMLTNYILLFGLSSLLTTPSISDAQACQAPLTLTSWVANGIFQNGEISPVMADANVTVNFGNGGNIWGDAGCNNYSARYHQTSRGNAGSISITKIARSRLYCPYPPNLMTQEDTYLHKLSSAASYHVVNCTTLVLSDAGGKGIISYEAVTDAESRSGKSKLVGTFWKGLEIRGDKDFLTPILSGSDVSLNFASNGIVYGSAGCNTFGGNYNKSVDSNITISHDLIFTLRECTQPSGVMKQEEEFKKDISRVKSYSIDFDNLDLLDSQGEALLSFFASNGHEEESGNSTADDEEAQQSSAPNDCNELPFNGTKWQAFEINKDVEMSLFTPETLITAVFEIGKLRGSASCETYERTYQTSADFHVLFGNEVSLTAKEHCAPTITEESAQQESAAYLNAVGKATGYNLTCDALMLTNENGNVMVSYFAIDEGNSFGYVNVTSRGGGTRL